MIEQSSQEPNEKNLEQPNEVDVPKKAQLQRQKDFLRTRHKSLEKKQHKVTNMHKRLFDERKALKKHKEALKVAEKGGIYEEGSVSDDAELEEYIKDKEVGWEAHPGPQTWFLQANEDEVLFSGGRGSGKSDCLIADPLRYVGNPRFSGLIIRRTMPELRELIARAKLLYSKVFPNVKIWKEQEKCFTFPSGARLEFGYCESVDDAMRYVGQQYCWLGVDEVTQYGDEKIIDSIIPSLRSPDESLPIYIRYTCNPGGPGRRWVKERFIDKGESNSKITLEFEDMEGNKYYKTRKWIHSTIDDNPSLGIRYKATLAAIPDAVRRAQWLAGNWDAADGTAFPEFKSEIHVIKPFPIPNSWKKFRACDWGYGSLAVVEWLAVDNDRNIYVYREFVANGNSGTKLTADKFAIEVLNREVGENIRYGYLDSSVWANRGEVGETVADTMLNMGCSWIPSDRSPGSRVARKLLLHNYLAVKEVINETGIPVKTAKIKVFDTCKELIKELQSLTVDKNNSEDVDTDLEDHAYDALTYGLASLPNPDVPFQNFIGLSSPPVVVNTDTGM